MTSFDMRSVFISNSNIRNLCPPCGGASFCLPTQQAYQKVALVIFALRPVSDPAPQLFALQSSPVRRRQVWHQLLGWKKALKRAFLIFWICTVSLRISLPPRFVPLCLSRCTVQCTAGRYDETQICQATLRQTTDH